LLDDPHCGDECAYWQTGGKTILCVVDGLGHGQDAERAAKAAIDYVGHHLAEPLPDIFSGCDTALRGTRGVMMGVAVAEAGGERLTYLGVGNTRATIVRERAPERAEGKIFRPSGNWGIVGGGYSSLSSETVSLDPGDLLFLYTDGVRDIAAITAYGEELRADLRRFAERLLEDCRRETDDAAVLIFRSGPG